MEMIPLTYPLNIQDIPDQPVVLALGFFDGLHRGHQKVIRRARQEANARGAKMAVMSFNQHPKIVHSQMKAEDWPYLLIRQQKIEKIQELGADIYYEARYTSDFSGQRPEDFAGEFLPALHPVAVVAGQDYTYGPAEVANMATLPEHTRGMYDIVEVGELSEDGHKVSSTWIRQALRDSRIEEANQALGYYYVTQGVVIHGFKRGRQLGYPTANLRMNPDQVLPGIGVFAVKVLVQDQWYLGMMSVGYNATFGADNPRSYEVYILDFDHTIYGEELQIQWHSYLRDEIKFTSVDQLIQQLDQDVQATREYFE